MNARNILAGLGIGGAGAGLMGMFGGGFNNPAEGGMGYLGQIPDAISPYYQPYINAGKNALPQLQSEYGNLISNPGGKLNEMGAGFHESPGFKFALQQALQGANHASAAGGMAGSPQNQQQNMELATQLGNQDYYNYLNQAKGLYGEGLQGMGGIANMGYGAGKSLSDQIAQMLASQSSLGYLGKLAENQNQASNTGNLFGGIGSLLAAFL